MCHGILPDAYGPPTLPYPVRAEHSTPAPLGKTYRLPAFPLSLCRHTQGPADPTPYPRNPYCPLKSAESFSSRAVTTTPSPGQSPPGLFPLLDFPAEAAAELHTPFQPLSLLLPSLSWSCLLVAPDPFSPDHSSLNWALSLS